MSDNLIVECITGLYAVNYLVVHRVSESWHHCHGLVIVGVEVCVCRFDFLNALLLKNFEELVVDERHTLVNGFRVVALVSYGSFEVVEHWQHGGDGFLSTAQYQLCLFLQSAFAVVVKFCLLVEKLVFEAFDSFFCYLLRFFWCRKNASGWHREEDKGTYHLWKAYYEASNSDEKDYLLYARILMMMYHDRQHIEYSYTCFHKYIAPAKEAYDKAIADGYIPSDKEIEKVKYYFESLKEGADEKLDSITPEQ